MKVVVALSGGVDSSVAAALLKKQGHEVIGVTLRLWTDSIHTRFSDSIASAQRVAKHLGIPLYIFDIADTFRHTVVRFFIDEYARGITPNPCVLCNRKIKWGYLLEQALEIGADSLATGHYARRRKKENGQFELLRAVDKKKDQSYVLHILTQETLARALFPVGDYTKLEIRRLANSFHLETASRSESQDLCFLAGEDYRLFLRRYKPEIAKLGKIVNRQGHVLGEHKGLADYTIGQRKGLRLNHPDPLYVLAKDASKNTIIVGKKTELNEHDLIAVNVNWIAGVPPPVPFSAQVKTRYTAKEAFAKVFPLMGNKTKIRFKTSQQGITPGQSAVIYDGEVVLGGGIII